MPSLRRTLLVLSLTLVAFTAPATIRYVDLNSPGPTPPYTDWSTAAINIQDAVDAAGAGDDIVVTNGVYATGACEVYGMSNRVAVTKAVVVRSVNGPAVTSIMGSGQNGSNAVRCVYLTNNALLAGFTLMNGATQTSGNSNTNRSGGGVWCEGLSAVVSNCVLTGNSASYYGGGAYYGTLNNCTLTGNSAGYGGGAYYGTLNNCTLTGNSAGYHGGGVYQGTLNNCIVYYNNAPSGPNYNNAPSGPRQWSGTLNYCCTTPLLASGTGNLSVEPELATPSHLSADSPCRGAGSSAYASGVDIDGEPWADPPAIGCDEYWRGSVTGALSAAIVVSYTNVAVGFEVDFQALIEGRVDGLRWDFGDGVGVSNRPWVSHAWESAGQYAVELRAYNESHPAGVVATVMVQVTAPVHYVTLDSPNPGPPYSSWATAATNIQDAVDAAGVAGALVLVTNGVYATGGREVYGMSNRVAVTKPVVVRSVNGPAVTSIVGNGPNGAKAVRCVYLTNAAVLTGFTLTNGATQVSGDIITNRSGGGVWCEGLSAVVSNCVLTGNSAYEGGGAWKGTLHRCTVTDNSASVGGGGVACSTLHNCALTRNSAQFEGGGVISGTLNDCTLTGNSAQLLGGGADISTLNNCTLTGNSAGYHGGGAYQSTLNNCTLTGNSAQLGGGAYISTLDNCIIYYNSAVSWANYETFSSLNYCCTTPLPSGAGNISNEPLFVDTNGWSNLQLQSNSPCINAGGNSYVTTATDLDGNPRIVGGTVDIGAYEFQFPASVISYAWLLQYGLALDGSADFVDSDNDQMNTWQEWRCDTVPTNAASVLRMVAVTNGASGLDVTWQSVATRSYFLERATNFADTPPFQSMPAVIQGVAGTKTYNDTSATNGGPYFYRVGVQ